MTKPIEPQTALGSEILKRMYQSKMTMKAFAERMALRSDSARNLISGKAPLTLERASALTITFPGTSMEQWQCLYQRHPFPVDRPHPAAKPTKQTRKSRKVDMAGTDEFGMLVVREAHEAGLSMMSAPEPVQVVVYDDGQRVGERQLDGIVGWLGDDGYGKGWWRIKAQQLGVYTNA
jgi:plasmid maintenance system antidote protein VapI